MQTLVSIITPFSNSLQFVEEALNSIQRQADNNRELLITVDASTDNICEIIEASMQKDERIKLFKKKEKAGAVGARNK